MDALAFHPLQLRAEWTDPENAVAQRLTIAILLLSAVTEESVEASIVDGGTVLEIIATWPAPLLSAKNLLKLFIDDKNDPDYNKYHPEVVAVEKSLKELRVDERLQLYSSLKSKEKVLLPFQVVEEPGKVSLSVIAFNDSTRAIPNSTALVLLVRLFKSETVTYEEPATKRPKLLSVVNI